MLAASTFLAIIITPVLAAWLLPKHARPDAHWYLTGIESGSLGNRLIAAMDWSLQHPLGAIALALVLPMAGYLGFGTLTEQFFPSTDRDQFYVQVKLADGRSIIETRELVEKLDVRLRDHPLIRRVDWTIGESTPAFYYNMYRNKEGIPTWAEALVLTRDSKRTDDLIRRLQVELDREFPAARIVIRGMDQGPPVLAPLEVEITGPNLAVLRELGDRFRQRMDAIPFVTHSTVGLVGGAPKLEMRLDEEKLRLARLQLADAAVALNDSLQGRLGGEVLEGTERLPVRVRLAEHAWGSPDQIADIRLPTSALPPHVPVTTGGIPLSALGKPVLLPAQSPISRLDGERINTVQAYITRGTLPQEALD